MDIEQARQQARDENTTSEVLAKLVTSKDEIVLKYVAGNPNTPVKILEKLSNQFLEAVTANPVFDLLLLENPDSYFVKSTLAISSTTSKEKLIKLAKDRDVNIHMAVAQNKNTFPEVLSILVKDSMTGVRKAVARNPNTPLEVLSNLAEDSDARVRKTIPKNPNNSLDTLRILLDNENEYIRKAARDNLEKREKS